MKSISVLAAIVTMGLLQQAGPRGGMTVDQLRQLAQPIGAEPIEVLDLEKAWAGVEPLMFRLLDCVHQNDRIQRLGELVVARVNLHASSGAAAG